MTNKNAIPADINMTDTPDRDEELANLRLASSAPDLLGNLKALLELMEDDHYK